MKQQELPFNGRSKYNERGEEICDPTPVALPVGFERPKPLADRIRELVRSEQLAQVANAAGIDTFDEADDFDIPDDDTFDRATPYEDRFEPEIPGVVAREQEIKSGFVEDIALEKKRKAQRVVDEWESKSARKEEQKKSEPDVK